MTLKKPLTVAEVMAVSGRGEVRVRNAANSGALKHLPRQPHCRFFFTEEAVADWIAAGSPEMPAPQRRGRRAA
ncbi:hypothetical protein I0Q12_19260 [Rhodococcus sp. CX]|uniref:hypothetical protein n=1 Tax=Rhodococcus sp. CX TaxID=2789880 RepID=UPI0018CF9AB8|nr:hypothetical protein [Rhodococcus sp. CX]MBH0121531.1 hypothetical protein [Rhodococcus sp. CX]